MALQHLRSSTANKRPDPTAMAEGQLALNTANASPGLFYKDATGSLIKSGPVHIGATAPNATPAAGGHAGNSVGEAWLDTSGTNPLLKIYNGAAFVTVQPVASGTVVSTADTGTVTSTMILDGTILNADINASAAIVDTKLATIATGGKVSNSATTATNANTASAIVARDASGNFTAGTITAALTGAASSNVLKAGDTMTGALVVPLASAATPSLTFTGDLNTGIYSPGADQVAVATNGVGRLFVDASGNVSIGSALDQALNVQRVGANAYARFTDNTVNAYVGVNNANALFDAAYVASNHPIRFITNNTEKLRITSAGLMGLGTSSPNTNLEVVATRTISSVDSFGQLVVKTTSGATGNMLNIGVDETNSRSFIQSLTRGTSARSLLLNPYGGNVGVGITSPSETLEVAGNTILDASNATLKIKQGATGTTGAIDFTLNTDSTSYGSLNLVYDDRITQGLRLNTAYPLTLECGASEEILFKRTTTENVRIDSSGRLLVGTSSAIAVADGTPGLQFHSTISSPLWSAISSSNWNNSTQSAGFVFAKSRGASVGTRGIVQDGDNLSRIISFGDDGTNFVQAAFIAVQVDGTPGTNDMPGRLVFSTTADGASSPTERMRISNDGTVFFNKTALTVTTTGVQINSTGELGVTVDAGNCFFVNRLTDDGDLVKLIQGNTTEGTISVSGTTVSYNGAHLSRWSQLPSGAERTEILRGSVLSNINEMCEWGDEDNEQLNRMKVSDVEGDKNVSGVFQAWDDDDDTYTNDFYCAMTGDFIIRIAAGTTVERGDLLMSAGDGTAKPQDDDIIRSKTIAKVTSTNMSCTYPDGSYCVPCVLMAC
jgi:hypothetical protein